VVIVEALVQVQQQCRQSVIAESQLAIDRFDLHLVASAIELNQVSPFHQSKIFFNGIAPLLSCLISAVPPHLSNLNIKFHN
jgi:hypothetical protein